VPATVFADPVYSDLIAQDGAYEYWRLDEASGNLTGRIRGIVLTKAGAPTYSVASPLNNCNGGAAITLPANSATFTAASSVILGTRYTVEFWSKVGTAAATSTAVSLKLSAGTYPQFNPYYGFAADARPLVYLASSNYQYWGAAIQLYNDGNWHHFVFTLNGTGLVTEASLGSCFIDGKVVIRSNSTIVDPPNTPDGSLLLGGDANYLPSFAELAVYPFPMGEETARRHYEIGTGTVRLPSLMDSPRTDPASFTRAPGGGAFAGINADMGSGKPRGGWEGKDRSTRTVRG